MRRSGFTLVELSLVLVIIGLIVAGILVGRDMIENANVRSQISQLEKINSAVNTFRLKYAGLPGDIIPTRAASFGMQTLNPIVSGRNGDGRVHVNGFMNSTLSLGGEPAIFWNDLSVAKLIPENLTLSDGSWGMLPGKTALYLPAAKIGKGNYITIVNTYQVGSMPPQCSDVYCYVIGGITDTNNGDNYYNDGYVPGITPIQAYSIDSKIDNGLPTSGNFVAGAMSIVAVNLAAASDCKVLDASGVYIYNTTAAYVNSLSCGINIVYR